MCCFFCFQRCSGQQAAKTITALPRATTIPGHITEQTQPTSLTMIDVIIEAPDTGMAACIMSGNQVTGHFAPVSPPPGAPVSPAATARYLTLVSSCGSMGVTSRKDTKPLRLARRRHVRLPSRDQFTSKPRNAPTSVSRRSWRRESIHPTREAFPKIKYLILADRLSNRVAGSR